MANDSSSHQFQGESYGPLSHTTHKGLDPLASKVTAILSTSYTDGGFREALGLLDDRGIVNDAKIRRQLRMDLQREVIDCNGEVIQMFGDIAKHLGQVRATIDRINASFETMKSQVAAAHAQNLPMLMEASSLVNQRQAVKAKQETLAAFKDHFIMSDDENATLTSTLGPVDDQFFECLQKAKRIRQDCELLLGFEDQTLGLELMDQTSKNINLGFQKLYKWVQHEFKTLNLENPQLNPSIRRALRVLAERPLLFRSCLDSFAESRERLLSEYFHSALTGTTSSGVQDPNVKPIDLTAHDPLRYVGDMLAWLHSATVGEHEALEVLFVAEGEDLARGMKNGKDAEIWRLVFDEGDDVAIFNARQALDELVDRDVSGAIRILRQRMEQIIQANEDVVTAYKVSSLISFYHVTFEKLLGPQSSLSDCVGNLESEAMRQFRALMRDQIAALQLEFQQAPATLEPPGFLQSSFEQLDAIIRTYEASLSSVDSQDKLDAILTEAFDPFVYGCDAISQALELPETTIFQVNYRLAAAMCLGRFDSTKQRAEQVQEDVCKNTAALVDSQYEYLRDKSGLDHLLESLLSGTLNAVSKDSLRRAAQQLDDFLPLALMDAIDRLKRLQQSQLARQLSEKAVEKFCRDFEELELAIIRLDEDAAEEEDESSWRMVFPRTTAELRVLLS